jgi:hypothetical protein
MINDPGILSPLRLPFRQPGCVLDDGFPDSSA